MTFLLHYGYWLLFGCILIEQLGAPLPSSPLLLAAGALVGQGEFSLSAILTVSVAANLIGDLVWYWLGRVRGISILNLLCRISLEPDSCVRGTQDMFARHGARALLVAKFVPGLATMARPLAGIAGMSLGRFLIYDTLGSLLWVGTVSAIGVAFSDRLDRVLEWGTRLGGRLGLLLGGLLAVYVLFKYVERQLFIRSLRVSRVTPEEVKRLLDGGAQLYIVDLRQSLDYQSSPQMLPGALHLAAEELSNRHQEIPRDRDIILYCT